MVTVNLKYGRHKVSIDTTNVFVTFETRTLTLYFKTKEESALAVEKLKNINARSTNYGLYIVTCPVYNTNINII
jgi:hypothetical protein